MNVDACGNQKYLTNRTKIEVANEASQKSGRAKSQMEEESMLEKLNAKAAEQSTGQTAA